MATQTNSLAANLERVTERIEQAANRVGRRADEITIVAVSKSHPAETVRAAYGAGLRHFGENRVQEFESKHPTLVGFRDILWHFIGHLQSNKAQRAVVLFDRIDSVDSVSLARKLSVTATTEARPLPLLIEIRTSDEETKSGVRETDLLSLARSIQQLPHLELRGLMTIPPYSVDPQQTRPYFARLRRLRDSLQQQLGLALPILSMGMSHDFEIAIEEGATEIRIGTALFGERARAET